MNRNQIRSSAIAVTAAPLLLLSAGAPAVAAGGEPGPAAPVEECSGPTAGQALAEGGGQLEPYLDLPPNLDLADTSGYSACSDLSWIVVPYGNVAHAPHAVLLFHQGEHLGTASADPVEHVPQIEQVADGRLAIVYSYTVDHQDGVDPEGRALSMFTWNDDTQSVDHEGDFPADHRARG